VRSNAKGKTTKRYNKKIIGLKKIKNIKLKAQNGQIIWYGHIRKTGEERLSKAGAEWKPQKGGNGEVPRHVRLRTQAQEGRGMAGQKRWRNRVEIAQTLQNRRKFRRRIF
jgi:hypothetical protein